MALWPPAPPSPVGDASVPAPAANADEADGEEWNDRLALAQDDELDELAARLGSYKPTHAANGYIINIQNLQV